MGEWRDVSFMHLNAMSSSNRLNLNVNQSKNDLHFQISLTYRVGLVVVDLSWLT